LPKLQIIEHAAIITEQQNALRWLQNNRTSCLGYRVTEPVFMFTELQKVLPWLQSNKTH